MKKLVSIIPVLFICFIVKAKTVSFEKLDSLSSRITQWQKQTDGKSYKDVKGGIYELSFPEENFKVWSQDKLATKAVHKKQGNKEVLALTENIDFAKAGDISVAENYNGVAYIKVGFPSGHLKTQIIEKGNVIKTINEDYLEFYYRHGAVTIDKKLVLDKMLETLHELVARLKQNKELVTEEYEKEFTAVDQEASFPGGREEWAKFLGKTLRRGIPTDNAPPNSYTVIVSFLVDKAGNISDVRADNDPGYGTADEAVRIIQKSPRWIPANQNGRPVLYRQKQPIRFLVAKDED